MATIAQLKERAGQDGAAALQLAEAVLMGDVVEPRKNYMYAYAEF